MDVVRGHRHAPAWRGGAAIAIGNFDGVHIGHRALIARARQLAEAHDARTVALTFDPHPSSLLSPTPPHMIASLERRIELLAEAGADVVVVEPFTRELAARAPHAFVEDILLHALQARAIVVGYDFCYGAGRAGTTETLTAHAGKAGVEVNVLQPVDATSRPASSQPQTGCSADAGISTALSSTVQSAAERLASPRRTSAQTPICSSVPASTR